VYQAVLRAGGNPSLIVTDDYLTRLFLGAANDDQLTWVDPNRKLIVGQADAFIRIAGVPNTRAKTSIDPKRVQRHQSGQREVLHDFLERGASDELKSVVTMYPTEGWAQEANMSLEEYEDFVYAAYFCNKDDPAAAWQKLGAMQQEKIDWLKGKKQVEIKGPNIELELSIADRTFINDDGRSSICAGEIFTGPVEDSVNGWVRFDFPSIARGRAITGIELRFDDGKVVEARAAENEEILLAQLDTDEGARYLGEFAIGTNYKIKHRTGQVLFDEKIGGTIHVALGTGYPDTGSKNRSAIHWDLICDLRKGGEIHVDGALFHKDGEFVV
jgi:aminopeptidase